MKKLFFLSLFASTLSFGQIKINPVNVGYPVKTATDLMVRVMPFETNAVNCQLYYQLKDIDGNQLSDGNLTLNIFEFAEWGKDMIYIEDLALSKLQLCRKED